MKGEVMQIETVTYSTTGVNDLVPERTLADCAMALTEAAKMAANASEQFLQARLNWHNAREVLEIAWKEYIAARERNEA